VADLHALLTDGLGLRDAVLCAGDLGGPVIQMLALDHPELVDRLALFNSPLPYDPERMAGMATRPPAEAADYFLRQGMDADALAAELSTPDRRRRYIATFYSSRFWAHPGAFLGEHTAVFGPHGGTPTIDFHTEPFADGARLRASFGGYESVFDPTKQSGPAHLARNPDVRALLLFGAADHVIYPDFDRMAAVVFPDHDGPHRLDGCGHFVPWEAADRLVDHLTRFCADRLG
jgi:pimeloyl-ACP methyl ester carboxylesterase